MTLTQATVSPKPRIAAFIKLLRPADWLKNGFVVAPLLLTPPAWSPGGLMLALLGAAAFSLIASSIYVLNDYLDRHSDRLHPTKRTRPIASGAVQPRAALVLGALVAVAGLGLAAALGREFLGICLGYLALTVAYCLKLKHIAIIDVIVVALGFVLRVEAGAALIQVEASTWIIIATGLLALFIALAKRRDDLVIAFDQTHRRSLEGYTKPFLDLAMTLILGALLVAYLVYTTDAQVMERLGTRNIFYTAPFVVGGILRYLQIALVEERSGSPVRLLLSDGFLISAVIGWAVSFALIIAL